jgi:hypothetical protein
LNNYRIPLGEYQFRRCLFAKKYLYQDSWDKMISFAFSRNPIDRCVSAFYYLFHLPGAKGVLKRGMITRKMIVFERQSFDAFLDLCSAKQVSKYNDRPVDLHFTTHVSDMHGDVSDESGKILLKHVFRLEDLENGIRYVFNSCDLPVKGEQSARLNQTRNRRAFEPTKAQIRKIEDLYAKDFDLYESAQRV